jgi:hypothetical protein
MNTNKGLDMAMDSPSLLLEGMPHGDKNAKIKTD